MHHKLILIWVLIITRFSDMVTEAVQAQILKVVEHPRELTRSKEGSDVYLTCKFNTDVYCAWTRNGNIVVIGGQSRYQFIHQKADGDGLSSDCGLVIRQLSSVDVGQWQCSNYMDDSTRFNDTVKSRETQIEMTTGQKTEL